MATAPRHARERYDAAAAASLPLMSGGLAVQQAVWAALGTLFPPPANGWVVPALHGGIGVALGALALAAHRGRVTGNAAERAAAAAALLAVLPHWTELVLTGDHRPATGILLILAWTGLGPLPPRLLAAVASVTWVVWIVGVLAAGVDGDALAALLVGLASATGLAAASNVTRRRGLADLLAARQQAEAAAVHDELTGVANRRGLTMLGTQIVEAARRQGDAAACLIVRVDGLGRVADQLGSAGVRDVLVAVAEALRACVRATDVVGRCREDEFCVVGPGPGMRAADLPRRLRQRLSAQPPVDGAVWQPRLSVSGAAVLAPWDAGDIDTLLDTADRDADVRRSRRARQERQAPGTVRNAPPETTSAD